MHCARPIDARVTCPSAYTHICGCRSSAGGGVRSVSIPCCALAVSTAEAEEVMCRTGVDPRSRCGPLRAVPQALSPPFSEAPLPPVRPLHLRGVLAAGECAAFAATWSPRTRSPLPLVCPTSRQTHAWARHSRVKRDVGNRLCSGPGLAKCSTPHAASPTAD